MIVSGRHVPAEEAQQARHHRRAACRRSDLRAGGDRLSPAGSPTCGRCRASATATTSSPRPRPIPACSTPCANRSRAAPATRRRPITASPRSRPPATLPFDEGMPARARTVRRSWRTPPRRRRCATPSSPSARSPSCPTSRATRPLRRLKTAAVVGAGTMGGGIAMSFADFGYPVKILEATQEALDRGMAAHPRQLRDSASSAAASPQEEMDRRLARIQPVASYDDIGDCDVVIEAVFERDRRQEGGVHQARRGDEARRAALLQHLGASTSTSWPT